MTTAAATAAVRVTVEPTPLVRPFQVSHMTTEAVDVVTLRLADHGASGLGEISADPGYDQDGPAIAAEAGELARALAGEPGVDAPDRLADLIGAAENTVSGPARTLVEMAFLDRAARRAGVPVWKLLGLPEPGLVQLMHTVPIGDPIPADPGGPLKIKLGGPDDAAVLRALLDVPGELILDVNRGWSQDDWHALRPLVTRLAPAVLEDPVDRPELLAEVRAALPDTAVVLDETVATRADVERAAATADGANIKLMKIGGLLPAIEALDRLTARSATKMLGCYLEPPRSIAYAAQLAGVCDWTDLDGHFWLITEPAVMSYRLDSSRPGIPAIAH
ncbi:enolase C-terminal domain-like protein [Streptomyces sp. NPDC051956]|uniref:enolase C-terminal domain-like protein n=1 Tax=Streptomyces sp. NPDC051956 TaxID=3365677 RepID=UPI0037CF3B67